MATERKEKPLPEFVKITAIGMAVAGKIRQFGKGSLGTYFAVLEPAFYKPGSGERWQMFGTFAVNLSADMLRKIDTAKDTGKFIVFSYQEDQPTGKTNEDGTASVKKIYKVLELDPDEIKDLTSKAQNKIGQKPPASVPAAKATAEKSEDADLPF